MPQGFFKVGDKDELRPNWMGSIVIPGFQKGLRVACGSHGRDILIQVALKILASVALRELTTQRKDKSLGSEQASVWVRAASIGYSLSSNYQNIHTLTEDRPLACFWTSCQLLLQLTGVFYRIACWKTAYLRSLYHLFTLSAAIHPDE